MRKVYVDLEAVVAWLRVGGVNAELDKAEQDTHVSRTIVLRNGETVTPLTVPFLPYASPWTHVSQHDFNQAMEMSKATLATPPITVFGKRRDEIPSLLMSMVTLMCQPSGNEGLYAMINRMSTQLGRKFIVSGAKDSYGPKGTAIATATITLDGATVADVICTGKQYSMTCSRQRLIEAVLKCAPPDVCRGILAKCFSLVL